MATKSNPGAFDCYQKAEPTEPMFILLARDAGAPWLVETWAKQRLADIEAGRRPPTDISQCLEALDCAHQMRAWREKNRPGIRSE